MWNLLRLALDLTLKYCVDQNVGFLNAKFDVSGIRYCFEQNVAFLNAKFDRIGIRTDAHIRVPEVSKENTNKLLVVMWNLLRLALDLTLRNTASTNILVFWTQNLTELGFDTAWTKMLPFRTLNMTGEGFEPTHTFVYQKSQRRICVWRLRPLGHPALSISHLLHPVFANTFL